MKKYILLLINVLVLSGCTPKIISQKSPLISLENKRCFIFPSKDYLLSKTIYEQKLYQLSEKALNEAKIKVYYGDETLCQNYLLTNWDITEGHQISTIKGTTITNTYNTGIYQYGYIPNQSTSYSYTTPDTTSISKIYHGTYSLQVGTKENGKIVTVWEARQSGELSSSSRETAEKIEDDDYSTIKTMIDTMLLENQLK